MRDADLKVAVESGLESGFRKAVPKLVDTVIDTIMSNPAYPVIVGGQVRLMQTGMKPREAWDMARGVVTEFLKDEKVAIGDPAYDWSPAGGATLVEEYEIDHWDQS